MLNLRHSVTFGGNPNMASLQGKPVVLKSHLNDAGLYSFAFRTE